MSDQASQHNRTKASNPEAVARASGRAWSEWLELFEAEGAGSLPHSEIARIARESMPPGTRNPDWWAQGAAIAFEQQAGLRVPGQSSTGSFRVSASRTLRLDRDAAVDAWEAGPGAAAAQLGHEVSGARRARTEKRSFWRAKLEGAGRVEISATPKDADRIVLAVNHEGLPDGTRIEEWRAHWKSLLAEI